MLESDFNEVDFSIKFSVLIKPIEPAPSGVWHQHIVVVGNDDSVVLLTGEP